MWNKQEDESNNFCSKCDGKSVQVDDCCKVMSFSNGKKFLCLTIIGEIEGHEVLPQESKVTKYEYIIPKLVEFDQKPEIHGVLVLLNTTGGDVEAGLAIAEVISGMKKPTASVILGGSHSIGVPIAVSVKKSFMVKTATMIIHPVRMTGITLGVSQSFEHFKRMQDRITSFVSENSGISAKDFKKLMTNTEQLVTDIGTVLDGEKAVKIGLIDKIGTVADALDYLQKEG